MMKLKLMFAAAAAFAMLASGAFVIAGENCKTKCETKCKTEAKASTETASTETAAKAAAKDPAAQEVVIDPVCGMDVKVSEAKWSSEYKDKTYYFCNEHCKQSFDKDPSKYIGGK